MTETALNLPGSIAPPDWSSGGGWRLARAMSISALLLAALLYVLPPLRFTASEPVTELLVHLLEVVQPAAEESPEPAPEPPPVDPAEPPIDSAGPPAPGEVPAGLVDVQAAPPDLEQARRQAVEAFVDRQVDPVSANPVLDEKQRQAAGQYRPPTREQPREIWENAEIDSMGRSILRHGDCYRVLDDPNVTRRYQFETFDQYMATCAKSPGQPRELPWVAGLRERYDYLQDADDDTPRDPGNGSAR